MNLGDFKKIFTKKGKDIDGATNGVSVQKIKELSHKITEGDSFIEKKIIKIKEEVRLKIEQIRKNWDNEIKDDLSTLNTYLESINWNEIMENYGINPNDFGEKLKKTELAYLEKNEKQFIELLLDIYNLKFDDKIIKEINIYFDKGSINEYITLKLKQLDPEFDLETYKVINFLNNKIITNIEGYKRSNFLNHFNIGKNLISYDVGYPKDLYGNKIYYNYEDLNIFVNGKKVITKDYQEKYFEENSYEEQWSSHSFGDGFSYSSGVEGGLGYRKYTFLRDKFLKDFIAGQIKTERKKTIEFEFGIYTGNKKV